MDKRNGTLTTSTRVVQKGGRSLLHSIMATEDFSSVLKPPPPASGFVELNKGPTSSEEDEMHMDLLDKCQSGT